MVDSTFTKFDCSAYPIAATDAEWYTPAGSPTPNYLMKQFTFYDVAYVPQKTIVLWSTEFDVYPTAQGIEAVKKALQKKQPTHTFDVVFCDAHDTTIFDVISLGSSLSLLMYYSPKDIEATIGKAEWIKLLIPMDGAESLIDKKRNLSGRYELNGTKFTLTDIFGAFNVSLDKAFEMVGVEPVGKGEAKGIDKSKMDVWMQDAPDKFLLYAVGDTADLGELLMRQIAMTNEVLSGAFGSTMPLFSLDDEVSTNRFSRSTGSLVAKITENWLMTFYPDVYRCALLLSDSNDNTSYAMLKKVYREIDEGVVTLPKLNSEVRSLTGVRNVVHGLGMGSIRNFALLANPGNTGLYGAMVQGGRCVNEEPYPQNPYQQRLKNVLDVDLDSAYGSSLRNFDYPIGIPTIHDYGRDSVHLTLGEWLKANEHELLDNLYTINVTGKLNFEQDLIHSKYNLSTNSILKTLTNDNWNDDDLEVADIYGRDLAVAHLGGDFVLTRKQIENGIITADILKTLRAVCSNNELSSIYNDLQVRCVVYYPKSLERTHEEFVEIVSNSKTRGGKYGGKDGDKRTRVWCRIPLEEFVGKLVKHRKSLKKERNNYPTESDDYSRLHLLQDAVKRLVNVIYGNMAAPFFAMGNTVMANCITARARNGVWMLSKALLTVQSITDGGIFSWDRVAHLVEGAKLPGLATLSDRQKLLQHRSLRKVKLTDIDLREYLGELDGESPEHQTRLREVNRLCRNVVDNFWYRYGLELLFDMEIKWENTCSLAAYYGTSDYVLFNTVGNFAKNVDPKDVDTLPLDLLGTHWLVKCRGARQLQHPKKLMLFHILDPGLCDVPKAFFQYSELLGVKDFQKRHAGGRGIDFSDIRNLVMPGDDERKTTYHKPYHASVVYLDMEQWKKINRTIDQAERRYMKGVQAMLTQPGKSERDADYYGLSKDMVSGKFRLKNHLRAV